MLIIKWMYTPWIIFPRVKMDKFDYFEIYKLTTSNHRNPCFASPNLTALLGPQPLARGQVDQNRFQGVRGPWKHRRVAWHVTRQVSADYSIRTPLASEKLDLWHKSPPNCAWENITSLLNISFIRFMNHSLPEGQIRHWIWEMISLVNGRTAALPRRRGNEEDESATRPPPKRLEPSSHVTFTHAYEKVSQTSILVHEFGHQDDGLRMQM